MLQVAGYPGTGGRMLLEWVAEYSGICSNHRTPDLKDMSDVGIARYFRQG